MIFRKPAHFLLLCILMATVVSRVQAQPTIVSMDLTTFNPTNDNTLQWSITFSEAVTGVSTANFSTSQTGVLPPSIDSVTSAPGGIKWIISVGSVAGDGTLGLDLTNPAGITGASGALTQTYTGPFYDVDNTKPQVLSINRLDPSPTNASTVNYQITFSEPVYGLTKANFAPGGSLAATKQNPAPTSNQAVWTMALSGISGSGTVSLDLTDTSFVTDEAGNYLYNTLGGEVYQVDQQGPQLVCITRLDATPTSASSVQFLVEFDEPTNNVQPANFSFSGAGTSGTVVSVTSGGSGTTWTATVDSIQGSGPLTIDLTDPSGITDGFGNTTTSTGPGCESYDVDRVNPEVVSIDLPDSSPTSSTVLNFVVTFSEPVTSASLSDFTLTGSAAGTITTVTTVADTVTVTVSGVSGPGSLCLRVNSPSTIKDLIGNPLINVPVTSACYIICLDYGPINGFNPDNGDTVPTSTNMVSFSPPVSGLTFHIYFDGQFQETTTATQSIIPQPLTPGQHSYIVDVNGSCTSGTQIVFNVLDAPNLVFPNDNFSACQPPRAFSWDAVEGATTYTLILDGLQYGQTTGTMLTLPNVVLTTGTHTWSVVAQNEFGPQASTPRTFQVLDSDPVEPGLFTTNGTIRDMLVENGMIYIAGDFTQVMDSDGTFKARNHVAQLSRFTFALTDWAPNVNGAVYALEAMPFNSGILLGGDFTRINNEAVARIGNIDAGTTVPGDFRPGANDTVRAIERVGTTVYYGGDFTKVGTQVYNFATISKDAVRLAVADLSTTNVQSVNVNPNASVRDLLYDGQLYVAGVFSQIADKTYHGLARFNLPTTTTLTMDATFINSPGQLPVDLYVYTMQKVNNRLYIGGSFNNVLGADRRNAAALQLGDSTTSTSVTDWDPRPNAAVHALTTVDEGSAVYLGGDFTSLNNMRSTYLVGVDPVAGFPLTCMFNSDRPVYAIDVLREINTFAEVIYVGGQSTTTGALSP